MNEIHGIAWYLSPFIVLSPEKRRSLRVLYQQYMYLSSYESNQGSTQQ